MSVMGGMRTSKEGNQNRDKKGNHRKSKAAESA